MVAGGDFTTLNRLMEASHAIHRAAVALGDGPIVPSRSDPVPPGPTVVEGLSPAHAQARHGRGYDTMTEEIQK